MILSLKEYKKLTRIENDLGRFYDVGEKIPVPSVTTVLSHTSDKSFLEEWKKKVGEEEAERIVTESSAVGEKLHDNMEKYLLNGDAPSGSFLVKSMSNIIIKKGITDKLDEVWGLEAPLYYPELYAGTTDLVGIYESKPAIIDFKNSRKYKKKEWIEDYFLQLVAYSEAHNILHGTNIQCGVILMATWNLDFLKFEISGNEYNKYKDKWYYCLHKYYSEHGTYQS